MRNTRAPWPHPLTHAQHRMHKSWSVSNGSEERIAPVGHKETHWPQPVHKPASTAGTRGFCPGTLCNRVTPSIKRRRASSGTGTCSIHAASTSAAPTPPSISLIRTSRPNCSATARSSLSGRPGAIGNSAVLYECSPTNAAAATTRRPALRKKTHHSSSAPS